MSGQERRVGLTVAEAAEVLGISRDAVRKRIARGTLQATKQDGEWTVNLDDGDQPKTEGKTEDDSHFWELIQDQRQRIEKLEAELEQKNAWIGSLIERIPPQLPAPEEPEQAATREGWWQRLWRRK